MLSLADAVTEVPDLQLLLHQLLSLLCQLIPHALHRPAQHANIFCGYQQASLATLHSLRDSST